MLLGDSMTFLKKANQKYLFYGFIALFLIGCANPVWWYRSPTSDYTHFDFDPTELNCIELTEEVIRVSAIISGDVSTSLYSVCFVYLYAKVRTTQYTCYSR